MNFVISQQNVVSLKQDGINKTIKKISSKVKKQKFANRQNKSFSSQDEAKYMFELTCPKDVQKQQQIDHSRPNQMSYLDGDVFSKFFKIISIQQQKNEIIVKFLPFKETNLFDIKKDFPFYINLEQISNNIPSFDSQRTLECIKQIDVPQEIFEFIINPNQDIIGCNRIVNNSWLKMFGINQDMMIHNLLRNQSFPYGWDFENQLIQNQISNTFSNQQMRVQLVCYNGSKFNAQIQVKAEIKTNSKKQFVQRYTIQYFISREQLSLQKVEQNFRVYFELKDLSQELLDKFIEQKTNKRCQIKKL